MRWHNNLLEGIFEGLDQTFLQDRHADQVVEKLLRKNKKWGSRDRTTVASSIYDIIRWKRLIQEVGEIPVIDKNTLRPLIGSWIVMSGHPLPEKEIFKNLLPDKIREAHENGNFSRAVRASIPDWLDKLGMEELGPNWEKELQALNREAPVVLRANTLKTDTSRLQNILTKEGVETSPLKDYPDALALQKRRNVQTTRAFREGLFEIQDASSQCVAPFLDVRPDMHIIDACAGGGGKTLHLAALSQNKAHITALDVSLYKLEELQKRAQRNGAKHITTSCIKDEETISDLHDTADRLLIDAPCSGSGVLRRRPDMKWKSSPELLQAAQRQQTALLDTYAPLLKAGGKMVYATCSIWPSENERQIETFLADHPHYKLLEHKTVSPAESGFDGFFIALIQRLI